MFAFASPEDKFYNANEEPVLPMCSSLQDQGHGGAELAVFIITQCSEYRRTRHRPLSSSMKQRRVKSRRCARLRQGSPSRAAKIRITACWTRNCRRQQLCPPRGSSSSRPRRTRVTSRRT
eukprot:13911193-Heterocapsa_arctica.AAC.1